MFVGMNVEAKLLAGSLPVVEIVWARTLVHTVFVVALFGPRHGWWRLFVTRRPAIQLTRSVLLLVSTLLFFTAIGRVPLADATAVSFTSPLLVAALAGPVLGERVDLKHWLAIALGFAGALIVIRPAGGATNPYLFLVVANSACYAAYQILTRRVARFDRPETSVTYSALIGMLALSLIAPFSFTAPAGGAEWAMLATMGLLGGLGHYYVARGLTLGPASILSPFHYVQLVGAAAMGFLVFGDVPSLWTWVGAAVIIASGLYIAWREAVRP
jgi:drug/metabolite transporter (DMT)-like permease